MTFLGILLTWAQISDGKESLCLPFYEPLPQVTFRYGGMLHDDSAGIIVRIFPSDRNCRSNSPFAVTMLRTRCLVNRVSR
jgi:hypothetical protein